jgi:AcrR family transcriptional regulator
MRKTREQRIFEIWSAAKKIFIKKGYQNTTMEDIILETDLSKGGVYHYYSSKREIIIDMMKQGNLSYMKYNPYLQNLDSTTKLEDKIEILIDAVLDKSLSVSDDKKIYTMFALEMIYDDEIWDIYCSLEMDFFEWLFKKLELEISTKSDQMLFIGRFMNGILFAQNMFNDPRVFNDNREYFKKILRPLFLEMFSNFNNDIDK